CRCSSASTDTYCLSLHDALPICTMLLATSDSEAAKKPRLRLMARRSSSVRPSRDFHSAMSACIDTSVGIQWLLQPDRYFSQAQRDRKSTRLNSSHVKISYAVFCL